MKLLCAFLIVLVLAPAGFAQAKPAQAKAADLDRLGLTCAQILQMTSTAWVAHFAEKAGNANNATAPAAVRAITAFGKCYEARTNQLAASLGKSGRSPLMGALGNFRDFQKALDDFTTKALAVSDKQPGSQEAAYAPLYAKQFRYEFYQRFEQRISGNRPLTAEESAEYSKAKNRFGEFLGLLPEDKAHIIHAAFSHIFDGGPVTDVTKLEVYRFAIFVLESPKDTPFSPPPF
ncbi:MAG TPA: hypothetical protein VIH88_02715 [Candidatus Acidoferrales bacterium]